MTRAGVTFWVSVGVEFRVMTRAGVTFRVSVGFRVRVSVRVRARGSFTVVKEFGPAPSGMLHATVDGV